MFPTNKTFPFGMLPGYLQYAGKLLEQKGLERSSHLIPLIKLNQSALTLIASGGFPYPFPILTIRHILSNQNKSIPTTEASLHSVLRLGGDHHPVPWSFRQVLTPCYKNNICMKLKQKVSTVKRNKFQKFYKG